MYSLACTLPCFLPSMIKVDAIISVSLLVTRTHVFVSFLVPDPVPSIIAFFLKATNCILPPACSKAPQEDQQNFHTKLHPVCIPIAYNSYRTSPSLPKR